MSVTGNIRHLFSPITRSRLARDTSFQSDSSHCSSVESLLELRRADPEAILLGLGFGGCTNNTQENGPLSRIPKRFLQPSKLKGIDINDFIKRQQETSECFDSASLGYRGLTGDIPSIKRLYKIYRYFTLRAWGNIRPRLSSKDTFMYSDWKKNADFKIILKIAAAHGKCFIGSSDTLSVPARARHRRLSGPSDLVSPSTLIDVCPLILFSFF